MAEYIFQGQRTGGDADVAFEHDGKIYRVGDRVDLTEAERSRFTDAAGLRFTKAPKSSSDSGDSSSSGSGSSSSSSASDK